VPAGGRRGRHGICRARPAGIPDHPTIRGHMNDRDKTRSRHVSGGTPAWHADARARARIT